MGTSLPVFVKLLKALDCGDCYFRDLSKDEMKALDDAHEASVAAGEVETRVRKIRSDAGKPKGKKRVRDDDSQSESDSDDEDAPALRKKKKGASSSNPAPKSKEVLSDTD
jgi:hypothetical protein